MQIAIDGPSGAGKSTVAKVLAQRIHGTYIDTGAMYRAIGLKAVRNNVLDDEEAVVDMLQSTKVDLTYEEGQQHIWLDGEDVSSAIRTPEISMAASKVSALAAVREQMVALQRQIAAGRDVVMDGRDIATAVLPDAEHKIFLTASAEERARRRYEELRVKGECVAYDQVLVDIKQRDLQDSTRTHSPLRQHPQAYLLDCTDMSLDEVVQKILEVTGVI